MNKKELLQEMHKAQASYGKINAAKLIDFMIVLLINIGPFIYLYTSGRFFNDPVSYVIFMAIFFGSLLLVNVLPIIITKGQTIGEKTCNMCMYDMNKLEKVNSSRIIDLWMSGAVTDLVSTDHYEMFHDLFASPRQSLKMKRLGYIYMDLSKLENLIDSVPNYQKIINPDFGKSIEEINKEIEEYYKEN